VLIFLDDERIPTDVTWVTLPDGDWNIVRSFEEFQTLLDSLTVAPSYISFDHDLGVNLDAETKTGYDCAKYYIWKSYQQGWDISHYVVHSMNPVGKENIEKYIEGYKAFIEDDGA
jgi:hypothetical protein